MRIKELTLYTKQIASQKKFYADVLGLEIIEDCDSEVSFKIENSVLRFVRKEASHPYHFAFNIPSNKVEESLKWLKDRAKILKDVNDEIIDFPAWNAKSIYFYDADRNILEFIARKNLDNSSQDPFTSENLLEISEIGLATNNFSAQFNFLTSVIGLKKFSGDQGVFCAIGGETGLFILIDKNRKDWFPANDRAYASNFIVRIEDAGKTKTVEYQNEKLTTISEP